MFLLHNGSDTIACGKSVNSACFSLLHVLMLYYAEPPTMGLIISTDKSLQIDNNLLVSSLVLLIKIPEHYAEVKVYHFILLGFISGKM